HRPDFRPGHRPGPPPRVVRGAGPRHDIYRGQRLPAYYRGHRYVVENWRLHRLAPPPRGHYWVQTGADYLLVAAATGLIVQIVLQ
ncbi:MAG: RcnB family protein, partial [Burkholderiaceae bacterium]